MHNDCAKRTGQKRLVELHDTDQALAVGRQEDLVAALPAHAADEERQVVFIIALLRLRGG